MFTALVLLGLSKGGTSSGDNMGLKGLHLGCRAVRSKNVRLAFIVFGASRAAQFVWGSIRSTLRVNIAAISATATCTRYSQLWIFFAKLLTDDFKVFSFLLVSGELGANVLPSIIVALWVLLLHKGTTSPSRALWRETLWTAQPIIDRLLLAQLLGLKWWSRIRQWCYFMVSTSNTSVTTRERGCAFGQSVTIHRKFVTHIDLWVSLVHLIATFSSSGTIPLLIVCDTTATCWNMLRVWSRVRWC